MSVATTDPDTVYDVLVIGGGINGAGIARDAAGRGLRVCLVEQDDLAAHTSSASTKLIHGGLRYLEHGELRLVRESLAERERLLAIAPHIVKPLRFVLPYVDGLRPRWLLRLGLFVYDHAGGRERLAASTSTRSRGHAAGRTTARGSHRRLRIFRLLGGRQPARGSERTGCGGARRHHPDADRRVTRGDSCRWRVVGSLRRSVATGQPAALRARTLVNATGAWVNELLGMLEIAPRQQVRLVKGSHLVLHRQFEGEHAYLLQSPDRRVVFAIPFEQHYTLVGTTDVPFTGDPAQVTIDVAERDYLLGCVNHFFKTPGDCLPTSLAATPACVRCSMMAARAPRSRYRATTTWNCSRRRPVRQC